MTEARGATYRSLIQRSSSSIRPSKNRTGETTFRTGSTRFGRSPAGPRTHPRTFRPWNGIWTSDPTPAANPTTDHLKKTPAHATR